MRGVRNPLYLLLVAALLVYVSQQPGTDSPVTPVPVSYESIDDAYRH